MENVFFDYCFGKCSIIQSNRDWERKVWRTTEGKKYALINHTWTEVVRSESAYSLYYVVENGDHFGETDRKVYVPYGLN